MTKKLSPCNIFCAICALCELNGFMLTGGGAIAKGAQAVLMVMGFYYFYIANTRYKLPIYFKGANLLLTMFTIYGVALIIANPPWVLHGAHTYLKFILESILPIYAFYVFAKEGQLHEKNIKIWYLIFIGLAIYAYMGLQSRLLASAAERGRETTEFKWLWI